MTELEVLEKILTNVRIIQFMMGMLVGGSFVAYVLSQRR